MPQGALIIYDMKWRFLRSFTLALAQSRNMQSEFDFIIVGAGSAGCVLANRLSAESKNSVLLLEFGGSDGSPFIQMPSALSIPMNSPGFDWGYHSEPEPQLNNRRLHVPRGKVIGGSSSVNGMVYVRGHAGDFATWDAMGAKGWNYPDVLPYFKKAETHDGGGDLYRGDSGPLNTRKGAMKNPLYRAFIAAGVEAGYGESSDLNGMRQEGFGTFDMTVHKGTRWSAANAYLRPALKRANLTLRSRCLVEKILFEGKKAVGVSYSCKGRKLEAKARRAVILCGGSINSPQLLQLSGIGDAAHLASQGVTPLLNRAGVGANLMDHMEFYFQIRSAQPITLYPAVKLWRQGLIGMQWLATRAGLGASNHFESGGFIRSRAGISYPDIQFHFLPLAVSYNGSKMASEHGFQAHVGPMRSKSRGTVKIKSASVHDKPEIRFNYLSHEEDWTEMRACVRLTRELFETQAFKPFYAAEIQPGKDVTSDEAIDAFVRQHAESAYHPSGTCKMGDAADPLAVVDPQTRVIGLENLHVVDSSIMPLITNGNLNAPTIMLAEKAADHILGKPLLPRLDAPVWQHPAWESKQR